MDRSEPVADQFADADDITGGQSRPIGPGDVLIAPPGVAHWFSAIESDLDYLVFRVDPGHVLPAGYVHPLRRGDCPRRTPSVWLERDPDLEVAGIAARRVSDESDQLLGYAVAEHVVARVGRGILPG